MNTEQALTKIEPMPATPSVEAEDDDEDRRYWTWLDRITEEP